MMSSGFAPRFSGSHYVIVSSVFGSSSFGVFTFCKRVVLFHFHRHGFWFYNYSSSMFVWRVRIVVFSTVCLAAVGIFQSPDL